MAKINVLDDNPESVYINKTEFNYAVIIASDNRAF